MPPLPRIFWLSWRDHIPTHHQLLARGDPAHHVADPGLSSTLRKVLFVFRTPAVQRFDSIAFHFDGSFGGTILEFTD